MSDHPQLDHDLHVSELRRRAESAERDVSRLNAGVAAIRDAIHSVGRPDSVIPERTRTRWRDMCDALLEGKGPSDQLWP